MTRKWRDNKNLMLLIKLFLIDEVHLLNEEKRGATLEVVVSRMKTVNGEQNEGNLRFIAISATCPNIEDIAAWLHDCNGNSATVKKFGEEFRPVKLEKIVITVPQNGNDFAYDAILNHSLPNIIKTHAKNKPMLIVLFISSFPSNTTVLFNKRFC